MFVIRFLQHYDTRHQNLQDTKDLCIALMVQKDTKSIWDVQKLLEWESLAAAMLAQLPSPTSHSVQRLCHIRLSSRALFNNLHTSVNCSKLWRELSCLQVFWGPQEHDGGWNPHVQLRIRSSIVVYIILPLLLYGPDFENPKRFY